MRWKSTTIPTTPFFPSPNQRYLNCQAFPCSVRGLCRLAWQTLNSTVPGEKKSILAETIWKVYGKQVNRCKGLYIAKLISWRLQEDMRLSPGQASRCCFVWKPRFSFTASATHSLIHSSLPVVPSHPSTSWFCQHLFPPSVSSITAKPSFLNIPSPSLTLTRHTNTGQIVSWLFSVIKVIY